MAAALVRLQSDTQDFWAPLHSIRRVDALTLTPLQFHREFVSRNVPVVFLNAMTSAPWRRALVKWQDDAHLVTIAGDDLVTVNMTPFGIGDAVLEFSPNGHKGIFVMPEERDMTFAKFLNLLSTRNECQGVPYLSHQNDSLRDQLPGLFNEVPPAIELAVEAFGNEPEAVNIWIGDERVVSTMHKDHYEVSGMRDWSLS